MIWTIKKAYYRTFQTVFKYTAGKIKYSDQKVMTGSDSLSSLYKLLKNNFIDNVLVVTTKSILKLDAMNSMLNNFENNNIKYTIFKEFSPNPTVKDVDNGYKIFTENCCKGIIVVGGGSALDCAKIIGIKYTNKNKSCKKLRNMANIRHGLPFFVAAPTTAGSGSESTVTAVISDHENNAKYPINHPFLRPKYVVLDPGLTIGLPPKMTSTTGMDALTHALEAYLGTTGTKYTNKLALDACKLIFENLETAYGNGCDLEARTSMLIASNYAGNAFTIALVGYVHSISHAVSALYNVPHGLANAVILPYVLDYYGETIYKKLANVANYSGFGDKSKSDEELAKITISKIRHMNEHMNIPTKIPEIQEKDIPVIVSKALKEANPLYPVPKLMNEEDCSSVVRKLILK